MLLGWWWPDGALDATSAWHSGGVRYSERLVPGPGFHLISVLCGGAAALVFSLWGPLAATMAGVATVAAFSLLGIITAPQVRVIDGGDCADGGTADEARLRAGGATIPLSALGEIERLDEAGLKEWMGTRADARAHTCHRAWVRTGVRIAVADARDATPYWLVCTRRPEELEAVLSEARRQAAHSEQTS
ncbi:hypothetical protein EDD31_2688 [Bogoriella caseilytica]|uniref:DUF3093 family protein n=1 Tax=Bogoriella caseilytica TaxID=56055 RepID=A0A3N2BGS6_9MICO|nr:hypothetical protein EDD31_2688 [Bogoriella caseilytica]